MTSKSLMNELRASIRVHGWHVTGVFPGGHCAHVDPGHTCEYFNYTTGLWETFKHPELMVFGMASRMAYDLFALVVDRIRDDEGFRDGDDVAGLVEGDYLTRMRSAPNRHPDYPTTLTSQYYGHRKYENLQLVLPDKQHRWPWEPECDPYIVRSQQALLPR